MQIQGTIRRIDDLGRVVIPKEMRRTLRIKEGDLLELHLATSEHGPYIKVTKHSHIRQFEDIARICVNTLFNVTNETVAICDMDTILATCPGNRGLVGCELTQDIIEYIRSSNIPSYLHSEPKIPTSLKLTEVLLSNVAAVYPIYIDAEAVGAIMLLGKHKIDERTDGAVSVTVSTIRALTNTNSI